MQVRISKRRQTLEWSSPWAAQKWISLAASNGHPSCLFHIRSNWCKPVIVVYKSLPSWPSSYWSDNAWDTYREVLCFHSRNGKWRLDSVNWNGFYRTIEVPLVVRCWSSLHLDKGLRPKELYWLAHHARPKRWFRPKTGFIRKDIRTHNSFCDSS